MINLSNYGRSLELLKYKSVNESNMFEAGGTAAADWEKIKAGKDGAYKNQYDQVVKAVHDAIHNKQTAGSVTVKHDASVGGKDFVKVEFTIEYPDAKTAKLTKLEALGSSIDQGTSKATAPGQPVASAQSAVTPNLLIPGTTGQNASSKITMTMWKPSSPTNYTDDQLMVDANSLIKAVGRLGNWWVTDANVADALKIISKYDTPNATALDDDSTTKIPALTRLLLLFARTGFDKSDDLTKLRIAIDNISQHTLSAKSITSIAMMKHILPKYESIKTS